MVDDQPETRRFRRDRGNVFEMTRENGDQIERQAPRREQPQSFQHSRTHDPIPQGEILVSTFTAGMHPKQPMEGQIMPVIFRWQLGIESNAFAKSALGQLNLENFGSPGYGAIR